MALCVPFQSWANNVAETQRLKRAAAKVTLRLQQIALFAPYNTWHENVSETKRLARAAEKVLVRWNNMTVVLFFWDVQN